MNTGLSANTKAILLLAAPLMAGNRRSKVRFLAAGEYRSLARFLHAHQAEPADLLSSRAEELIDRYDGPVDKSRLKALLDRGFLLSNTVERWQARAIWVMSRADDGYPTILRERLKKDAPVLLFGCGSPGIIRTGGLAIVGSRDAPEPLIEYTSEVASQVAHAGLTVISGAARGVDRAAMVAASKAGGQVVGVLAGDLERTAMNREYRDLLLDERLVLVSPYDPSSRFSVGQAMQRNKVIYGLAEAGLVVNAVVNRGGTWAGAVEQLQKYSGPVFIRSTGEPSDGLDALKHRGAIPWPNPGNAKGIKDVLGSIDSAEAVRTVGEADGLECSMDLPLPGSDVSADRGDAATNYAEEVYRIVRSLAQHICAEPKKASEVARELGVTQPTANAWIKRLVDEGTIEKRARPIRYVAPQKELFGRVPAQQQ